MYTATEGEIDGKTIHDGVEVDSSGRVIAYHICTIYPGQYTLKSEEWIRVKAVGEKTGIPNILHIMNAERPDQYRGVSYLANSIEIILQNRRHVESTLMASIIQTYYTAWITTNTDPADMPNIVTDENADENSGDERHYDDEPEMAPGNVIYMKPNESVSFGNPNIPTANFETFANAVLKQVGAGLEMPFDVLLKAFNSSYSASKGALEEAWEAIKKRRAWFVSDFCQPVYEAFLAEAVALGRINAPGFFDDPLIRAAWCESRWDGPAQTHLDPLKEANANMILVANGWKTNEQITREFYGENWEENMRKLEQENELKNRICPPQGELPKWEPDKDEDKRGVE